MFLDADDYYEVDICKVLINNVQENKSNIGIINKKFWINDKEVSNVLYNENYFSREGVDKELFLLDLFTSLKIDK